MFISFARLRRVILVSRSSLNPSPDVFRNKLLAAAYGYDTMHAICRKFYTEYRVSRRDYAFDRFRLSASSFSPFFQAEVFRGRSKGILMWFFTVRIKFISISNQKSKPTTYFAKCILWTFSSTLSNSSKEMYASNCWSYRSVNVQHCNRFEIVRKHIAFEYIPLS